MTAMARALPMAGNTEGASLERVVLAGNPNTGKTTLFNALCGARAKTSNFPGTTTAVRTGRTARPGSRKAVDVLDLPGSPRVIGMPGHSPGSIAVHVPAVDAVFVGDALTTRHVLTGADGPQPAPFTDDPDDAIASLQRLTGLDATWVLPGHGTPWNGGIDEAVRLVTEAAGHTAA